jgi:hypothetical protein
MALHANTSVDSNKLILGNYAIGVATVLTSGTSVGTGLTGWTNLGAGVINSFAHNVTQYDIQAGNAPDPIEGVAYETFTISGELMEYDAAVLASAFGGILSSNTTSTYVSVLNAGGKTEITPKSYKLFNNRIVSGVSVHTYIVVYKAKFTNGPQFTAKADDDTDPISTMAFELEGVVDSTRTAGDQLYSIHRWVNS